MASSSSSEQRNNPNSSSLPVEFTKDINGLDKVILREARGISAEIYLYGAHVTSWKNENGDELLFLSNKAIFEPPKPILGGIPISFPQFKSHGILEAHGFASNRICEVRVEGLETTSTSSTIAIVDEKKKRTLVILKDGLPDGVVWNPWDKEAKPLADFGDVEYTHMLCVEAAAVEKPVTLKPGEDWTGRQELSIVPSSCTGPLDPQEMQPQPQKLKRKKLGARPLGKKKQKRLDKKLKENTAKERFDKLLTLEAQSDGDMVTWGDVLNAEVEETGDVGDTGIWEQEYVAEPIDVGGTTDSLDHSTSSVEGYSTGSDF